MSNLIDLSKKLSVRAEVLKQKLLKAGFDISRLDQEIPQEAVQFLETGQEPTPSPDTGEEISDLLSDLREEEESATENAEEIPPEVPLSEQPVPERPPPLFPDPQVAAPESEGDLGSNPLLASLEGIEEIHSNYAAEENLPNEPVRPEAEIPETGEDFSEEWEEVSAEPPAETTELSAAYEDSSSDLTDQSPFPEETGGITSEELQRMVDELAPDLVLKESLPPTEPVTLQESIRQKLSNMAASVEFTIPQKALLGATIGVALVMIGVAGISRYQNYGSGASERFYREGVRHQHLGEHHQALEDYGKVEARFPKSPWILEANKGIAEVKFELGEYVKSAEVMRVALNKQRSILSDATEEWTQRNRKYRWDGLSLLGDAYIANEEWDSAVEKLEILLEETDHKQLRERSLFALGGALYHQARENDDLGAMTIHRILETYGLVLAASPENKEVILAEYRMAELWEELGSLEPGYRKEHYRKALRNLQSLANAPEEELAASGIDPLELKLNQGRLLRKMGSLGESIALYRTILDVPSGEEHEEESTPFRVSLELARSLLARGQRDWKGPKSASAEQDLYEALEQVRIQEDRPFTEDELTEALYLRGHSHYTLGRMGARPLGDLTATHFDRMESAYQSAVTKNPFFGPDGEDSLLALIRTTNYRFQISEDLEAAVTNYRQILNQFPDNRYSYRVSFNLAEALYKLRRYEEAEREYRRVVETAEDIRFFDPHHYRVSFYRLGECQFMLEDFSRASKTLRELLDLVGYENTPKNIWASRALAASYFQLGFLEEAVDEYRTFLEKFPGNDPEGKVRFQLGITLLEADMYGEGREELGRVIEKFRGSETARRARYTLCESYIDQSDYSDPQESASLLKNAEEEAKSIREEYPVEDQPLYILGRIFFKQGDFERASTQLNYYLNAARGDETLSDARFLLGQACLELEDYACAINAFGAIDLTDLDWERKPLCLYLLAESYRLDKKYLKAYDTYKRVVVDYPTSDYAEMGEQQMERCDWLHTRRID